MIVGLKAMKDVATREIEFLNYLEMTLVGAAYTKVRARIVIFACVFFKFRLLMPSNRTCTMLLPTATRTRWARGVLSLLSVMCLILTLLHLHSPKESTGFTSRYAFDDAQLKLLKRK
jgi:hypothetical protein